MKFMCIYMKFVNVYIYIYMKFVNVYINVGMCIYRERMKNGYVYIYRSINLGTCVYILEYIC